MAGKVSSDPNIFLLPDIGEGLTEAELKEWKVSVGQRVEENDTLAEVETDKALAEIPSPRSGVIATLHGEPGQMMLVGEPFVSYVPEGGAPAKPAPKNAKKTPAPTQDNGTAATEDREDAGTVVGQMSGELVGVSTGDGKVLATPAVRRLARDMGVDLTTVVGTGIGGRITSKDVRAAATGAAPARSARPAAPMPSFAAPPAAASTPAPMRVAPSIPEGQATLRVPFRGVRRKIAQRLRHSVDQAVHFTVMDEADVTELDTLRRRLGAASGEKVSLLPFVASAVCRALTGQFNAINAQVDEPEDGGDGEIIQHRAVHLGIAADTEAGLMVPVIRDCDALGVLEIGRHIAHLAGAARDRSIPREQLAGSTFTISNVGSHAGRFATPVINYPEVGILAAGRAREGMVVKHGMFRVGLLLPLSLACDHRVIDGATAAMCLARIVELLQNPEQLLTPARAAR